MKTASLALKTILLALACSLFLFSVSFAQPAQQARQALATAVDNILSTIRNPEYANPATRGPLKQRIEKDIYNIFDFGEFSSRTVGPRWKTFSPETKKSFADAFANLMFNTYLSKVTGYNGEKVDWLGELVSKDGKQVEVRTSIAMKDGKKIPVNYRMLDKNGSWRVYDVIIENISLVKNYRTQFQSILNSASPEELIGKINDKAREVAAQGESGGK